MKTALITGASGEIGAAIARHFAGAGYGVAAHGAKALRGGAGACRIASGERAHRRRRAGRPFRPGNLRARFFESEAALGPIDVLVNGAGMSLVDFFDAAFARRLERARRHEPSSAVWLSQCAARSMIRRKAGAIVNISSIWGVSGAAMEVAYSAVQGRHARHDAGAGARARTLRHHGERRRPGYIDTK